MNFIAEPFKSFDELLTSVYTPDGPGAAVLVKKDGQTLLRKGYGLANIELGVPIEPETVFRIGSVTKQFTAVLILMLLEQGKLSLDDPMEKFLPDYPTHGHTITIEHLLTHTSGIKSYTGMPEFWKSQAKDFTVTELVDFFKFQPMDFAPGKRWSYSNSGYALLGAVIEKVSGMEYAPYLQQQIFDPLEMKQSYYDSPKRLIQHRACGYSKEKDGVINAPYLSMTAPYAAGALVSTVDDLALWNEALDRGSLLKEETLQRAWTPYLLADQTCTYYGYGWSIGDWAGWHWVEHGGGINGFTCATLRIPSEKVFAAVLTNCDSGERFPNEIAVRAAGYAVGKPFNEPALVLLPLEQLSRLSGAYQQTGGETYKVSTADGHLEVEVAPDVTLIFDPISPNEFVFRRNIFSWLKFNDDENGKVSSLSFYGRYGTPEVYTRIEPEGSEI